MYMTKFLLINQLVMSYNKYMQLFIFNDFSFFPSENELEHWK